jgi:hypothetical protein
MPQKGAGGRGAKPRNAVPRPAPRARAPPKQKGSGAKKPKHGDTKVVKGVTHVYTEQGGSGWWSALKTAAGLVAKNAPALWSGAKDVAKAFGSGYKQSGQGFRQSGQGAAGLRHTTPLALPPAMRKGR